jgi:hypothetical protein
MLILFISSYLPWWFGDVTKPTIILKCGIGWFGMQHHFWFFLCFRSIHFVLMADNPIKAYRFEPKRQIQNRLEQISNDSDDSDDDNLDNVLINLSINADGSSRLTDTEWCACTKCDVMPTAVECLCCSEIGSAKTKINEFPQIKCITEHEAFPVVCLNTHVLQTALVARRDLRPFSLVEPIANE